MTAIRQLTNLMLDSFFTEALRKAQDGWRRTVALGATLGIPTHDVLQRAFLLRFLPQRAAAREPASGTARLLRRAHLRAHRQAARRILPFQLDGPGRHRLVEHLQRLTKEER